MKNVVTATGVDELNKMMNMHPQMNVVDIDLQKQEKIWEKFIDPAYSEADVLVITDKLEGPFSKYELLEEVRKQFKGEIYVILTEHDDEQYIKFLRTLKITNIFSDENDPMELIDAIVYDFKESETESEIAASVNEIERIEKVYINKQVLAIVGTGGSGKSTMAIELANILSQDKYDVVVVDLNFEKPDIGKITGVDEKGVQTILKEEFNEKTILEAVTKKKNIYYFTGLQEMVEISEANKSVKGIIKSLKKHFDVVILDTGNISSAATHTAILESDQQLFLLNSAERSLVAIKRYLDLYIKTLERPIKASALINQYVETGFGIKDYSEILGIKIHGTIKLDKRTFIDIEKGKGFERDIKIIKQVKETLFHKKENNSGFNWFKKKVVS